MNDRAGPRQETQPETIKRRLRRRALAVRADLGSEARTVASRSIAAVLAEWPLVTDAKTVMVYAPIRGEVDPSPFVETLWERGVAVAFPVALQETKTLAPRLAERSDKFTPGAFGIPAPPSTRPALPLEELDVVVVPALAYDRNGFRLGYGGGYYDRLLPLLRTETVCIGLTYQELLWDLLPREPHDIPVDWIVTERERLGPTGPPKSGFAPGSR